MQYETLTWDGFLGKNTKADDLDIKDTQALEIDNLRLMNRPGKLVKVKGYSAAALAGTTFTNVGIEGLSINCLAELVADHPLPSTSYFICQAGAASQFFLWDPDTATWTEMVVTTVVDTDVINFIPRGNAILFMVGSGATNVPVLTYFSSEVFKYGYTGVAKITAPITASLGIDTSTVKRVDSGSLGAYSVLLSWFESAGDIPDDVTVGYKISLQYDNGQWSRPSDDTFTIYCANNGADGAHIQFKISIPAATLNSRITGLKIYRCNAWYGLSVDVYRLVKTILFNKDIELPYDYLKIILTNPAPLYNAAVFDGVLTFDMVDDGSHPFGTSSTLYEGQLLGVSTVGFQPDGVNADAFTHLLRIDHAFESGGHSYVTVENNGGLAAGMYYIVNLSGWNFDGTNYIYCFNDGGYPLIYDDQPEMWEDLGFVEDESEADYSLNYETAVIVAKRQFVARYWDASEGRVVNNVVRFSSISTGGSYDYDIFHGEDAINTQDFGIYEIVALGKWMDKLVIYGKTNIAVLDIGTGSVMTWRLNDTYTKVGLAAAKSLVNVLDSSYFIATSAPAIFRNMQVELLPHLESQTLWPLGVTNLAEAVGGFDPVESNVMFSFPTDKRIICFNTIMGEFTEIVTTDAVTRFLLTSTNQVLLISGIHVFEFNASPTFNGSGIKPLYYSKTLRFPGFLIAPYGYEIRYSSVSSALTLKFYLDGVEWTIPDQGLAASLTWAENFLPAAKLADRINFSIGLTDVASLANTKFEIAAFVLKLHLVKKRG